MTHDDFSEPWTLSAPETMWLFDQAASRRGEGLTFAVLELVARGVFVIEYFDPPEIEGAGFVARLVAGTESIDSLDEPLLSAAQLVSATIQQSADSLPLGEIPFETAPRYHDEVLVPALQRRGLLEQVGFVDRVVRGVGGKLSDRGEQLSEEAVERLEHLREFLTEWSGDWFDSVEPAEAARLMHLAGALVLYDWDSYAVIEALETRAGDVPGYPYVTSGEELDLITAAPGARMPHMSWVDLSDVLDHGLGE